ncbi:MAG: PEGA domain-containing protein [Deltaproteobacteria bacterium]|nr:PEGA domain-containing protein [Deltaproteobacteria bacterium]
MKALFVGVLGLVMLMAVRPVQADGTPHRRTVVLRLDFEGSVNEVSRDQLVRRLFEGLAAAGFQVFSADEPVAKLYQSSPQLKSCEEATCYMQIAAALQANFLVVGKVEAKRRDYDIQVRLIDGRTGEVLETTKQRCDVCGIQEAGDTVNVAGVSLRSGLDKVEAPAQITFESRPSGALVESDGQPLGFTPLTQELNVGVHQLSITKPGYKPTSRSIEVLPGSAQSVSLDLVPQPGPFLSPGWRTAGWVSLTVGVAAMGVGSYLLSLQGDGTNCTGEGAAKMCPEKYEVRWASAGLLAGGGMLAGLGGLVVFVAPSVVEANTLKSDAGQASTQTAFWRVVLSGNF